MLLPCLLPCFLPRQNLAMSLAMLLATTCHGQEVGKKHCNWHGKKHGKEQGCGKHKATRPKFRRRSAGKASCRKSGAQAPTTECIKAKPASLSTGKTSSPKIGRRNTETPNGR